MDFFEASFFYFFKTTCKGAQFDCNENEGNENENENLRESHAKEIQIMQIEKDYKRLFETMNKCF